MSEKSRLLTAGTAAAMLIVMSTLTGNIAAQNNSSGDGRNLYDDFGCAGCHGYEGQGTVASPPVPRLAPTAYPYEAFAAFVRTPPRVMPAYSPNVLTEAQLRDIYGFIQSIPEPPAVDEIPALRNLRQ